MGVTCWPRKRSRGRFRCMIFDLSWSLSFSSVVLHRCCFSSIFSNSFMENYDPFRDAGGQEDHLGSFRLLVCWAVDNVLLLTFTLYAELISSYAWDTLFLESVISNTYRVALRSDCTDVVRCRYRQHMEHEIAQYGILSSSSTQVHSTLSLWRSSPRIHPAANLYAVLRSKNSENLYTYASCGSSRNFRRWRSSDFFCFFTGYRGSQESWRITCPSGTPDKTDENKWKSQDHSPGTSRDDP